MKRPKKPLELEEDELDAARHAGNGRGLEDDEEILDLDDILTDFPEEGVEEGIDEETDIDLDFAELLDAESGLKIDVTNLEEELNEEDLLDEEDLTEDLFRDLSQAGKTASPPTGSPPPAQAVTTEFDFEDQMESEEDIFSKFKEEPEKALVEGAGDATVQPLPETRAEEEPAAALEDFVSRIESQLLQSLREMVEARLPDIVRAVLQEEIEKMKKC